MPRQTHCHCVLCFGKLCAASFCEAFGYMALLYVADSAAGKNMGHRHVDAGSHNGTALLLIVLPHCHCIICSLLLQGLLFCAAFACLLAEYCILA